MMILIYDICRYIMLPEFNPIEKPEICFKYLGII